MEISILEVEKLSFSYGSKPVFSDISFQIEKGELFCLAGPNGCGKSTLLHCILGHLKYQSGDVLINNRSIRLYSPEKLADRLAYVPQNHTRSFPYRVLDVVTMGQVRNKSLFSRKNKREDLALAILEELGVSHLAEEEYTMLSGGELQMVLIARALCQDSDILILDEPTAHLDIKRTQCILNFLFRFAREKEKSVIISTHDFNHPLQFEDMGANIKMALMDHGKISRVGTPLSLLSSDSLEQMYQIKSCIVQAGDEGKRHYIVTWSD